MIDVEDWKRRLAVPNAEVELDGGGQVFEDDLHVNGNEVRCTSISISNVEIKGELKFSNAKFKAHVSIQNCKFKKLGFYKCNFDGSKNWLYWGLSIANSEITDAIEIYGCTSEKTRLYFEKIKTQFIYFRNCMLPETDIEIRELDCYNMQFTDNSAKDVNFTKITVSETSNYGNPEMQLNRNYLNSLTIWESGIANCMISSMHISENSQIGDSVFKLFSFREPQTQYALSLHNNSFKERFHIALGSYNSVTTICTLKYLSISDCTFYRNARVVGNENYPAIDYVSIKGEEETSSTLELYRVSVGKLDLNYRKSIRNMVLEDIRVGELWFKYMENSGQLVFSGVVPWGDKPAWYIIHSHTGNWNLNNCDLRRLEKLTVENSDLSGLRYLSVDWFKPGALVLRTPGEQPVPGREPKEAENRREVYRMLKEAAEDQKDRIGALRFQQEEMRAHETFLKLTKPFYNSDRIVLWASKSNDHGLNWWKPVLLAAIFSIPFYIAIVIGGDPAISRFDLDTLAAWKQIFSRSEVFPQMLNPVHAMDKMFPGAEVHRATWWFDYAHRLLMAFFIVQTVSAFRKYMHA